MKLSIRQRRSLKLIEQELISNDSPLARMFAEFADQPGDQTPERKPRRAARPQWMTGGPWSPWE
jgi:hypothetical protein